MSKRLYKSNTNKMVDGVCGSIAEYFGIDPTLIRIGWILFCATGGSRVREENLDAVSDWYRQAVKPL